MSGRRRAALGLVVLAAGVGLVARWLAVPSAAPATAEAEKSPAAPAPEAAPGPDRSARVVAAAPLATIGEKDPPAGAPGRERACPDLDQVLAELVAQLGGAELYVAQVYDPAVALWADPLDAHCLGALAERAAEELRRPAERLAALSLLRRAHQRPTRSSPGELDFAPTLAAFALTAGERRLLEQTFDVREQAPVPLLGDEDELAYGRRVRRDQLARVAGACLAVLGEDADRLRLVEALDDSDLGMVARASLAYTRSSVVAVALAEHLLDPARDETQAALALMHLLDDSAAPALPPELAARLADGLLQRWRDLPFERGSEGSMYDLLLARLDPQKAALRWVELLDAGLESPDGVRAAASALTRSGFAADHARLDALLLEGEDAQRLAAASGVLFAARNARSGEELEVRALGTLEDVYRSSPDPLVRRQVFYVGRGRGPRLISVALQALERDEDMLVREAAIVCLRSAPAQDPAVRAALVRAAESDPQARVRKAATQALR